MSRPLTCALRALLAKRNETQNKHKTNDSDMALPHELFSAFQLELANADGAHFSLDLNRISRPDELYKHSKQSDLWAHIWGSTAVLSQILLSLSLSNTRTLELGAGSGAASLFAALAGSDVTATDLVPEAVQLIEHNALRNELMHCASSVMDWNKVRARRNTQSENTSTEPHRAQSMYIEHREHRRREHSCLC
jgi:predicted nicotinamide N-methyase